ncbi:hypothetical protein [Streptomyces sp. NPDC088360]|uniref:hypothetical protein n=1 Tax=Streptomyces sp. NPDC088360 TaxID=3154515 RepID=UPI00344B5C62
MLTTDSVPTRFLTETQAQRIVDHWNQVYPAMRAVLDTVIRAQRGAEQQTVDVARLERVRRELGQLDRGTFRGVRALSASPMRTSTYVRCWR